MRDNHLGRRPTLLVGEISELRSLLHFLSLGRPVSRDPESSLCSPSPRVLATCLSGHRQRLCSPAAWHNLGHPQGTLSLHKEEAVRESPGRR